MTAPVVDAGTRRQTVIRAATLDDVPALVTMGREQLAGSYGDLVPETPGALAVFFAQLVTLPTAGVWVAEQDRAPVAMLGLALSRHGLSGVRTATEVMWWVDPGARISGLGLALLRHAERWAGEQGAAVLQVVAPATAEGARVGRLYAHRGYRALETSYQRTVGPPARALVVVDDVLPDLPAYVAAARAQRFGDLEPLAGLVFHGIAPPPDDYVPTWIAARWPSLTPTLSLLRQSPAGQPEPTFLHADTDMGDWTALCYLTEEPPEGDGTIFWRSRTTGACVSTATTAETRAEEQASWRDLSDWEPWTTVEARPNRLVLFPARYLHSRALLENYGAGATARLLQITFGTGAVPPAGG